MKRLAESEEVLNSIKEKALRNALESGTYGTRSEFKAGKRIISFGEQCSSMVRRRW